MRLLDSLHCRGRAGQGHTDGFMVGHMALRGTSAPKPTASWMLIDAAIPSPMRRRNGRRLIGARGQGPMSRRAHCLDLGRPERQAPSTMTDVSVQAVADTESGPVEPKGVFTALTLHVARRATSTST